MATSGKFQSEYNSRLFKKSVLLEDLQSQFKYWTYPLYNFHFQSAHVYRLVVQIFDSKMATSEKFQSNQQIIQNHWKNKFF